MASHTINDYLEGALQIQWWISIVVLFICVRTIYRQWFHPLARFPGPRLAASTGLYAAYYDIVKSGSFIRRFSRLHDEYGPIVRILPNELHVQSIESHQQIFRIGTQFDKANMKSNPLFSGSLITLTTLNESRKRREFYSNHFSKAAVRRAEFLVQAKLSQFLKSLKAAALEDRLVNFTFAFRCLTADIVMQYAYQKDFGALKDNALTMPFIEMLTHSSDFAQWHQHCPLLFCLINRVAMMMPEAFKKRFLKPLGAIQMLQDDARARIEQLKYRAKCPAYGYYGPTIFDSMLSSNIGKGQVRPSDSDITAEAILMLEAGMGTTGHALCVATWNILSNPDILAKLTAELKKGTLESNGLNLENLEGEGFRYLRAVVKESLRFSYGAPGRLLRKVPPQGATLDGIFVPGGTSISSAIYSHNHSDPPFKDPFRFNPDRWMTSDPAEYAELDRHMVSFSRGSRQCLGKNLAYAELYLIIAQLFSRFDIDVRSFTSPEDMEWRDCFVPTTNGYLRGKVMLKGEDLGCTVGGKASC